MASICLVIRAHQPFVLRHYSVFDRGVHYFDAYKSNDACRRYATGSILPANRVLLSSIRKTGGRFKPSIAVSGSTLDLCERCCPDVLDSFRALRDAGAEFLVTPYTGALPLEYSASAFDEQVELHRERVGQLLGFEPGVFCNSALIHDGQIADRVAELGLNGAICDGSPAVLAGRTCSRVYAGGSARLPLLLRNERLSREVSERFTDRGSPNWPITAPRFAEALGRFDNPDEVVTLFWDYSTFGLDLSEETGIFEFLRYLPEKVLEQPGLAFATCSEAIERHQPVGEYVPADAISVAEESFSLDPWMGNPLQTYATQRLYAMEHAVRDRDEPALLRDWRRLLDCEYIQAMRTDFRPQRRFGGFAAIPDSPYDAFINFMNVLDSIAQRAGAVVNA